MHFRLTPQQVVVAAPVELVWEMISSAGRGQLPGSKSSARLVGRPRSDVMLVEFTTHSVSGDYKTLEAMRLFAPDRIVYRHLSGPVPDVTEEIKLIRESKRTTTLAYRGRFGATSMRGYLLAPFYIRPRFDKLVLEHLLEIKSAAEARAARSKKYPRHV